MALDAPHWSYLHGCQKHRGEPVPCQKCIDAHDPAITQDGSQAFDRPSTEEEKASLWDDIYRATRPPNGQAPIDWTNFLSNL